MVENDFTFFVGWEQLIYVMHKTKLLERLLLKDYTCTWLTDQAVVVEVPLLASLFECEAYISVIVYLAKLPWWEQSLHCVYVWWRLTI